MVSAGKFTMVKAMQKPGFKLDYYTTLCQMKDDTGVLTEAGVTMDTSVTSNLISS